MKLTHARVIEVFDGIIEDDVLEDRFEYTLDDLRSMYSLTVNQAAELYAMIVCAACCE
jgi:hypothetical protein